MHVEFLPAGNIYAKLVSEILDKKVKLKVYALIVFRTGCKKKILLMGLLLWSLFVSLLRHDEPRKAVNCAQKRKQIITFCLVILAAAQA